MFVIWKFLVAFLKGPSEPSMDAENLRFGQIVGAEQVTVRCLCYPRSRKLIGKELTTASSSL